MTYGYIAGFYLAVLCATPAEGKWDFKAAGNGFDKIGGRILAVTKNAVTVSITEDFNNKKTNEVLTYPFHTRLASGSFNLLQSDSYSYRRDDLKAGDYVALRILTLDNKIEYCVSLSIVERPGGKIPPTIRNTPGDWQPYHEWRNAHRSFENDKIALPPHLTLRARPYEFPAFDPGIPKADRLPRFPYERPFTYIEFALFLR